MTTWPLSRKLRVGDRVRVSGSYYEMDSWMDEAPDGYTGTVTAFIPGDRGRTDAVVRLDREISVDVPRDDGRLRARGRYLVLALVYRGEKWTTRSRRLHVELCDFEPEPKAWRDRRQGAWVESHAHHEVLPA